jgi:hypothetical protein
MLKLRFHSNWLSLPCLLGIALHALGPTWVAYPREPALNDGASFFREKIEPVLKKECFSCHSAKAKEVKGGLQLDTRLGLRSGGDSGPIVIGGKADKSRLVQAIRHEGDLAMPPEKPKLPAQTIADFVKWVEMGAPDPRPEDTATGIAAERDPRLHWAFQPVRSHDLPVVKDKAWSQSPLDAFILARLEQQGWLPAPAASRAHWLRRVGFDLAGLPPSPEEIVQFENDVSADSFERVVDRHLASPRYGERWAQHWLDVVRYAETEGYEYDRHVPDAWRFRDYVIRSLNRDKPFDRFLTEQIAGDEIEPEDPECLAASIFHRIGPVRRNAGNPEIALSRNEVLTERTDIVGTAFLGLTVGCARCHNHKLEPIAQRDYYQLQAYFAATSEHNILLASSAEQKAWEARTAEAKLEIQRLQSRAKQATGEERDRLTAEVEALEDKLPPPLATIPSTRNDFLQRTAIHVLRRGEWENKGDPVGPRPLSILVASDLPELPADVTNPRTRLAEWLTSPKHPLTARVITNRLWQSHFGIGIVKTANDFGVRGDPPSHPELLDHLSASLIHSGWSLKQLQRRIVLSSTYRQSGFSVIVYKAEQADPENRLLWRFSRRRLSAEELRDAMLAVSGRLNLQAGGRSVMIPVAPQLVEQLYKPAQWQVAESAAEYDRRSVYLIAKRNLRLPFLEVFDAPALLASCSRRQASTHAPQTLELLNGQFSNDLALAFSRRLQQESGGSPEKIVERAFRLTAGRDPTPLEQDLSLDFLFESSLTEFALAMLNLNEFLYVP